MGDVGAVGGQQNRRSSRDLPPYTPVVNLSKRDQGLSFCRLVLLCQIRGRQPAAPLTDSPGTGHRLHYCGHGVPQGGISTSGYDAAPRHCLQYHHASFIKWAAHDRGDD